MIVCPYIYIYIYVFVYVYFYILKKKTRQTVNHGITPTEKVNTRGERMTRSETGFCGNIGSSRKELDVRRKVANEVRIPMSGGER